MLLRDSILDFFAAGRTEFRGPPATEMPKRRWQAVISGKVVSPGRSSNGAQVASHYFHQAAFQGRGSDHAELVADAPDGGNLPVRIAVQLFAETLDMDIHGAGISGEFIAPDMVEKLLSREDLVR